MDLCRIVLFRFQNCEYICRIVEFLVMFLSGAMCLGGAMGDHVNGMKKKRRSAYSSDEEEVGRNGPFISEGRYREMLGDHVLKYKRRSNNNASQSPGPTRTSTSVIRSNVTHKDQKLQNDRGVHRLESSSEFFNGGNSQRSRRYHKADSRLHYGSARCASSFILTFVEELSDRCTILANLIAFKFILYYSIKGVLCFFYIMYHSF